MAERETSYDDDHLCAEYEPIQDGDLDEPVEARLEDLSQQIEALEERETYTPPETLAFARAMVCIDDEGKLNVRRGLVSPADAAAEDADDDDDVADAGHGLPSSHFENLRNAPHGGAWRPSPEKSLPCMHKLKDGTVLDATISNVDAIFILRLHVFNGAYNSFNCAYRR